MRRPGLAVAPLMAILVAVPAFSHGQPPTVDRQYLVIPLPEDLGDIDSLRGSPAEPLIYTGSPETWRPLPESAQLEGLVELDQYGAGRGAALGGWSTVWSLVTKLGEIVTGASSIATAVNSISGSLESDTEDDELEDIKGRLDRVEGQLDSHLQWLVDISNKIDGLSRP